MGKYDNQSRRKRLLNKSYSLFSSFDPLLVLLVFLISLIGIVMVYNSSIAIATRDFADKYHFFREQLRWLIMGYVAFTGFSLISYRRYKDIAGMMFLGTIVLLFAVFLPGIGVNANGANRWVRLGPTLLQPAELTKLTIILFLSSFFTRAKDNTLFQFLIIIAITLGLVLLEPDMGTSMVLLCISMAIFWGSGAKLYNFLILIPVFIAGAIGFAISSPYRMNRLLTFFNSQNDPLGASYQIRQALLAIGSGGIFGVGLGKSRQKYEYLPEANTDSIFAIFAEEAGLIGSIVLISLFAMLVFRGFRIAVNSKDKFGRLIAVGITSWIGFQSAINLSAMVSLIPLTGIPLPLVSYGGSSLIITLSALGILLNISKHSQKHE